MTDWFINFIEKSIEEGLPVEIILLLVVIFMPIPISFFFYKLLKKQSKALEDQTKALTDVVEQSSAVMVLIQGYILGDETITNDQSVIIYEDFLSLASNDLFKMYEKTKKWLDGRNIIEDAELEKQLQARVFNHFEAVESNLMDKLRCFKHDGRWFSEYQMTVAGEWRHMADNIYSTIATHENGIHEYLGSKSVKIVNCFNLWLKDGVGYDERN